MPSIFTTYETYLKIAIILLYTGFIWYCHGIYDDHKITKQAQQQEIKSQDGEAKLVTYEQKIKKVYIHDKCTDVRIPSATLNLLH